VPKELKSVALVDELVEKLETAIFRGDFPPGAPIREARLAASLGVARGSMREALQRLEGRRLVVRSPNSGTSVAKLTRAELSELLEIREGLEVTACRLAAVNITDEDLAKLKATQIRQEELRSDRLGDLFGDWHNWDFHYQVALASGNRRLVELLCRDVWCLLRLYRYPGVLSVGPVPLARTDHWAILEALTARDPEACERAMREHLSHARVELLKGSPDEEPPETTKARSKRLGKKS
jgi:DNA-binding GntR family transcriptional regulator